jgi:protein-disulfide isomerase
MSTWRGTKRAGRGRSRDPWGPWDPGPARKGGRRLFAVLGAVVVMAAALAGLASQRRDGGAGGRAASGAFNGPPPSVTRAPDGAAVLAWGDETAPLLEIFTDYQCPDCKTAQVKTGPVLRRLVSQGRVRVVYRPVQSYRGAAGEPAASNSRRAGNASLCAPATGWLAYHEALFAHQPAEGAAGFGAADLIALAERAGIIGPSFPDCVTGDAQSARLDALTRYASDARGVRSLPAAFLDGRSLDRRTQLDAARLEAAVHAVHAVDAD